LLHSLISGGLIFPGLLGGGLGLPQLSSSGGLIFPGLLTG